MSVEGEGPIGPRADECAQPCESPAPTALDAMNQFCRNLLLPESRVVRTALTTPREAQ